MKALNLILSVLLIAAIVAGVVFGIIGSRELGDAQSTLDESEKTIANLREEITEANFKYRGVRGSLENIPDSLKTSATGEWMQQSRTYAKKLRGLEEKVREAERLNRKYERAVADVRQRLTRRLMLFGGAVVVLTGALVARRVIRS
jgi:DNA repair ATPase RecN